MSELIIDARQYRTETQRLVDVALTAILWATYFMLSFEAFLFLGMVAGWLVNPRGAWLVHHFAAIIPTLISYAEIAAAIAALLYAWAFFNRIRYGRRRERRRVALLVKARNIGQFFNVGADQIQAWQRERRLVIHHDGNGQISWVEVGFPEDRQGNFLEEPAA